MQIEAMRLSDFLKPFPCDCGKPHTTDLKNVEIGTGVLFKLPEILRELNHHKAFVLADQTTFEAAGRDVLAILEKSGFPFAFHLIPQPEVTPDETTLGSILMAYDRTCDVIVGVGSGTINDISRFLSYQAGLMYFIVGTAPSMDGFASSVAPMITNNLKTTYETHVPQAIIADLAILSKAPMNMIAAGFGDILGKYTCLADWKLSHIINGEYYCPTVAGIMNLALTRTIESRDGLKNRDMAAIQKLTEALILAGIAMSYVGNSRPASGCEHHLSHFWEMRFLFEGRKAVLHGTKVGIGEVAALKLHELLQKESIDFDKVKKTTVPLMDEAWEGKIRKAFQAAAPEVIALEKKTGKNAPEGRLKRIQAMEERWPEIQEVLASLPSSKAAEELLASVGGPIRPREVGLTEETVRESILYAKEVRNRYTVLQMLWDFGLLESYADKVTEELFA